MFRLLPLFLLASCFYVTSDDRRARFDLDEDGVQRPEDCDDDDKQVGRVTWYADTDGDGFGDPGTTKVQCDPPEGFVDDDTDCDDADPVTKPGAVELCNGVDDDCDGVADNGVEIPTWYEDLDGDGQGDIDSPIDACDQPAGAVSNSDDCDDGDVNVNLGGTEVACNSLDDDCDGDFDLDDADIDLSDWTWYFDGDGDLYGTDDTTEVSCAPSVDFVVDGGDCEDGDVLINPGVAEECNGFDDNCDGAIDPYGSVGAQQWWPDADGDGRGDNYSSVMACAEPIGPPYAWLQSMGDCDDTDACVYAGAQERCNGNDDDCDTVDDDGCIAPDTGTPPGGQCF